MIRTLAIRLYMLSQRSPLTLALVRNGLILFCVWSSATALLRSLSFALAERGHVEICWPYSRRLSAYFARCLGKNGFDNSSFLALCFVTPSRFLFETFSQHQEAITRDPQCLALMVRKGLESGVLHDSSEISHTQADLYRWTMDTVMALAKRGDAPDVLNFVRWFAGTPPLTEGPLFRQMAENFRMLERIADTLDVAEFTAPAASSDGRLRVGLFRYNYAPHGEVDLLKGLLAGLPSDISFYYLGMAEPPAETIGGHPYVQLNGDVATAITEARALALDVVLYSPPLWGSFHNTMTQLIAHRIAPTQIYYLGDVLTSGMPTLDYLLFPDNVPLAMHQENYTETLLPVLTGAPPFPPFADTLSQASMAAADGSVTYVTNCHVSKLNDRVLRGWAEILSRVPRSRLLLCPYTNEGHRRFAPVLIRLIYKISAEKGIDPCRFVIRDIAGLPAVRAQLASGQVYLDSFPYTGCFSTAEALRIGLPCVCLVSDDAYHAQLSRMVARQVGLENEIIFNTADAYIDRAVALGLNVQLRQEAADCIRVACDAMPLEQLNHSFSVAFWDHVRATVRRSSLSTAA